MRWDDSRRYRYGEMNAARTNLAEERRRTTRQISTSEGNAAGIIELCANAPKMLRRKLLRQRRRREMDTDDLDSDNILRSFDLIMKEPNSDELFEQS